MLRQCYFFFSSISSAVLISSRLKPRTAKASLDRDREEYQARTDRLITTLRDVVLAYSTEGEGSQKFTEIKKSYWRKSRPNAYRMRCSSCRGPRSGSLSARLCRPRAKIAFNSKPQILLIDLFYHLFLFLMKK